MSFDEVVERVRELAQVHLSLYSPDFPTNLQAILAGLGIELFDEPFDDDPEFTGVAVVNEDWSYTAIVVNSLLQPSRWGFTVAHEVGHIVCRHRPPRHRVHERLANIYASELLMPRQRLVEQIRHYGRDVALLAGLNHVSIAAMRIRLQELATDLAQHCVPYVRSIAVGLVPFAFLWSFFT